MERRIGTITVVVEGGDITRLEVDAVVNAANTQLWMGGGVAGAIKRAGGVEIEREAMARGPIRIGDAVATGGGRLPARHVIHAATMGPDLRTSAEAIRSAAASSLRVAETMGLSSIALPLLGTGVGGFSLDEAAALMAGAVAAHAGRAERPSRIVLVGFSDEARQALERAVKGIGG
jgi:O-acetyl-ADP-ribose deacetylase (regulator of RNase III)